MSELIWPYLTQPDVCWHPVAYIKVYNVSRNQVLGQKCLKMPFSHAAEWQNALLHLLLLHYHLSLLQQLFDEL